MLWRILWVKPAKCAIAYSLYCLAHHRFRTGAKFAQTRLGGSELLLSLGAFRGVLACGAQLLKTSLLCSNLILDRLTPGIPACDSSFSAHRCLLPGSATRQTPRRPGHSEC